VQPGSVLLSLFSVAFARLHVRCRVPWMTLRLKSGSDDPNYQDCEMNVWEPEVDKLRRLFQSVSNVSIAEVSVPFPIFEWQ
jgi:hypothetical protein